MSKQKNWIRITSFTLVLLIIAAVFSTVVAQYFDKKNEVTTTTVVNTSAIAEAVQQQQNKANSKVLKKPDVSIPIYSGKPYTVLNHNKPYFDISDVTPYSYEYYGDLDEKGRCTTCQACIGSDLMPTEPRGEIGMIKPTGWHTIKYNNIDKKYLYNRCHLIGYQLTGENANPKNLITGTRYLNVEGMLPWENKVSDYINSNPDQHVFYRVTPVFEKNDLLAQGVIIEASSVEDLGKSIQFCVFCYNVQPGIEIDYTNGNSKLA